ncbi:MAG TPA: S8 family serine peptidase [Bryobacteraceae bacterium]|nr:S8 family serine peptidase [Bryobacteraceae bacterium]
MINRYVAVLAAVILSLSQAAHAQQKKRADRADQLPRFTYPIEGKAEDLLTDNQRFAKLAEAVRTNLEKILSEYQIADASAERAMVSTLAAIAMITKDDAAAVKYLDRARSLQEKEEAKLTNGLEIRAILAARAKVPETNTEAFRAALRSEMNNLLKDLPWNIVERSMRGRQTSFELLNSEYLRGTVRSEIQPLVDKEGALSDDSAARIIAFRQSIASVIAWRGVFLESIGEYIARSNKPGPDIWPAREVRLPEGKPWKPVVVSAWDSGSDPVLFEKVLVRNADGTPAVIAYDRDARKASGFLEEIPEQLLRSYGDSVRLFQGNADMRAGRATPEAAFTKARYQSLKAEDAKTLNNELNQISQYMHGTHVASILLEGNPYARLFVARHTFDMRIPPAAPSRERAQRIADSFRDIVTNMKAHKVRVANMSWSWSTTEIEDAYEKNGIGATSEERRKKARELWDIIAAGLKDAIESAPEILFVASGGNDNSSNDFVQVVPGNLRLPNLLLVGAVDQAGEETNFTSYGSSVIVHANGYQVPGLVPGGHKLPMSGTSMAAPGVANLAAKILTVASEMTPQQVIEVIRRTAERSSDGRRNLIHPKNALAAVQSGKAAVPAGSPRLAP